MRRFLCLLCLLPLFLAAVTYAAPQEALRGARVVLDPGHGGDDWGVDPAGNRLLEKDVALAIAARLERQLEARGAQVYVTRSTDQFVSLGARVRFANAWLFRPDNDPRVGRMIALHLNSNLRNPRLQRVEVLVDPQASVPPFAVAMARALDQVTGGGFGYRDAGYPPGTHPGDIASIRWTYPRGQNVLTEAVFLSNPAQAAQLRDASFLEKLAAAHVAALEATLAAER